MLGKLSECLCITFYWCGPREERMWPKGGENTTWKQKGSSGGQEAEEPWQKIKELIDPRSFHDPPDLCHHVRLVATNPNPPLYWMESQPQG